MEVSEFNARVTKLVEDIGNNVRLERGQNEEIFFLHNTGVEMKIIRAGMEYGKSCTSCVIRTYRRVKEYYTSIQPTIND